MLYVERDRDRERSVWGIPADQSAGRGGGGEGREIERESERFVPANKLRAGPGAQGEAKNMFVRVNKIKTKKMHSKMRTRRVRGGRRLRLTPVKRAALANSSPHVVVDKLARTADPRV
jgi:hypothetical protein